MKKLDHSYSLIRKLGAMDSTKLQKLIQFVEIFDDSTSFNTEKNQIRLSELNEKVLSAMADTHSPSTLKNTRLASRKFIEYCGNIEVREVDVRIAEDFTLHYFKKSKSTAKLIYSTLKSVFESSKSGDNIPR